MSRIPNCEYKDSGCDDPRCKRTFCVLGAEERDRAQKAAEVEAEEIRKEAVSLVELMFRVKRRPRPTDRQVAEFLKKRPDFYQLAKEAIERRRKEPPITLADLGL